MLTDKRIEEAERNTKNYLAEGLIRRTQPDKNILDVFLTNARESITVADSIKNISDLWVIVCSYYAMFYAANAVLLKNGYKVGDKIVHKVTADALIVYIRHKLATTFLDDYETTREEALNLAGVKADELIASFDFERHKRSTIQYSTLDTQKHAKAATSLQRAKTFTKEMEKLLL